MIATMLRRCRHLIVQNNYTSDLRTTICCRWLSNLEDPKKPRPLFVQKPAATRDRVFRTTFVNRPLVSDDNELKGTTPTSTTIKRPTQRIGGNDGRLNQNQTHQSAATAAAPATSRMSWAAPRPTSDVTVESLMERMNGDPLNLRARNPLASALASIQREKEELNQIFGAPLIDDMVSLKSGNSPVDPNAFDRDAYQQYRQLLDKILSAESFSSNCPMPLRRDLIEWLHTPTKIVDVRLSSLENARQNGLEVLQDDKDFQRRAELFKDELKEQQDRFKAQVGINQVQLYAAAGVLSRIGRRCAQRAWSLPLEVAWAKAKEAGLELPVDTLVNYLHVVSSYPGRSSDGLIGNMLGLSMFGDTPQTKSSATEIDANVNSNENHDGDESETGSNIPPEIACYHDLLYKPSEKSISVRVKYLVSKGETALAEALLEQSAGLSTEGIRQRTCLPLLKKYLDKGELTPALKLFSKIKNLPSVVLTDETFVQLIAAFAESGCFSPSATPIEGAIECGYNPGSGPRLFDQMANEMSERCVEINSVLARRLYNALETGFRGSPVGRNVETLRPLSALKPFNKRALPDELIVSRVTIDRSTGACPRSGITLRLLEFNSDQKQTYRERLYQIGENRFKTYKNAWGEQSYNENKSRPNPMKGFTNWLSNRTGEPFTVIIDGANVAYHMQNFEEGKFSYYQIEFIVRALENLNENPLVVLPWKFMHDSIRLNPEIFGEGQVQVLSNEEKAIRDRLLSSQKLFRVAGRWHDDLFLMIGTLSDQVRARKGKDLTVEPDNQEGRWPGIRPVLVTNDQFRDNWPSVLDQRLFRRWYSSCVVNYKFVGFYDSECVDDHISFSPGEFFSREIQSNTLQSTQGEETVWHFPVSDWGNDGWFCIKIPN